jgi:hypothetical protein
MSETKKFWLLLVLLLLSIGLFVYVTQSTNGFTPFQQ